MNTLSETIHAKTIQLDECPDFAEGAAVEIVIRPARPKRQPGDGFRRTEGALIDDPEWDQIMDEVQQARHRERRSQE